MRWVGAEIVVLRRNIRNIWVTVKNIRKRHLSTETSKPDYCLRLVYVVHKRRQKFATKGGSDFR